MPGEVAGAAILTCIGVCFVVIAKRAATGVIRSAVRMPRATPRRSELGAATFMVRAFGVLFMAVGLWHLMKSR